jgi:UDP-N-acetylglucosamine--N-acetylmuramyl-(pentapeptide) pyrophosphoryl-undecaprenol N-acetylglucosamine transferase
LAARGGAFVVLDDEASAERVASLAESLLADPHRMLRMGRAARAFGKPDAAERLAGWVFELAAVQ